MATTHIYKLTAYPQQLILQDGTLVLVRPMIRDDEEALLEFFQEVSEEERFFLKEDVTSPKVIRRWVEDLDYDRALPLLALVDHRIVADATLHRSRAGARRHVGEVRIVVHPDYRSRGVGAILMHQLMTIAHASGLELLTVEVIRGKQEEAIGMAQGLGFTQVAVLRGWAKGADGRYNDVVILEALLRKWFEWWPFSVSVSRVQVRFPW